MRAGGPALLAVLLVGLNLRAGIAAVAPVVPAVQAELDVSPAAVSLLTTVPVLCFALAAPLAAAAGARLGLDRAVGLGLLVLAVGAVARVGGGFTALLVGTVAVGVGITVGNVLVPAVLKRDLPERAGAATGVFTASLTAGAALAAFATVPLAAGLGWRPALASWGALAVLGLLVWTVRSRVTGRADRAARAARTGAAGPAGDGPEPLTPPAPPVRPGLLLGWGRRPVARALAVLLGTQAAAFYALTAWLPSILTERAAVGLETAGVGTAAFHLLGVPGTLLVPLLLRRGAPQRHLALGVAAAWVLGLALLLVAPAAWPLAVLVLGLAQGAGISLALTLVVLRAADADAARGLSGFVQTVGYLLGGGGPLLAGALQQATGGWTVPLLTLVAVCVVMAGAGVLASRPVLLASPEHPVRAHQASTQ